MPGGLGEAMVSPSYVHHAAIYEEDELASERVGNDYSLHLDLGPRLGHAHNRH